MGFFDVYDIPLTINDNAQELVYTSGHESVRFPMALAECFSRAGLKVEITMDLARKSSIFPGSDDDLLLATTIVPLHPITLAIARVPLKIYTNTDDLRTVRYQQQSYGFNAANVAKEYLRIYKHYYEIQA